MPTVMDIFLNKHVYDEIRIVLNRHLRLFFTLLLEKVIFMRVNID